jgi:hypothetical protein
MTDSQFSPKQIEANRRNAARSSGPATPQGKAVARMNAAKHGVLARQTLIPGEDAEELAELETALARQLRPAGATEEELFGEIVSGFWRLRRLRQAEAAVFAEELRGQRRRSSKSSDAADPRPHGIDRATIELGAAFQAACDTLGPLRDLHPPPHQAGAGGAEEDADGKGGGTGLGGAGWRGWGRELA